MGALVRRQGGGFGNGAAGQGAVAVREPGLLGEMNTTPLVDVMLVLLVMFIITMPLSTHAVKLDLPVGKPAQPIDPVVNRVAVSASGEASWNGAPVSRAELRRLMADSGAMAVEPEMHLLPDAEAPYAAVDSILADAKRAEVTKLGFVGNQAYQAAF